MADFGIGEIAAIAGLASAAVGTVGAVSSANAQSQAAKYNSEVAANNQTIANQNANFAAAAGNQQIAQEQAKTRAQVGAIIAQEGATGVDVNTGSNANVQASEAEIGKLDALNTGANDLRTVYGYETQASGFGAQSTLDTMEASNASTAGAISAGSTLLGGASSAATNYANYLAKTGGFGTGKPAALADDGGWVDTSGAAKGF